MGNIKRCTKKILSILTILAIIINLMPNIGLLRKTVYASTELEKAIVIKPELNEFTTVTTGDRLFKLNIYLNNVTTAIFSLNMSYPSDKLAPAELNKMNIPGMGEITSLTETTSLNKVVEFSNLINNPYDSSVINEGMICINAIQEKSEDFIANGEVLICSISFKVKENVENFNDLSYKDFKVNIDESFINIDVDGDGEGEELSYKKMFSVEEFGDSSLPRVESIAVTTNPTKEYYLHGNKVDLTGGILTATYTDNHTEEISMLDANVTIKIGEKQITSKDEIIADFENQKLIFEYEDETADLDINVINPVEKIEIYDKNNYLSKDAGFEEGETLEKSELYVKAIRTFGEDIINLPDNRIAFSSYEATLEGIPEDKKFEVDGLEAGIQAITVTYNDEYSKNIETDFTILVNDTVERIEIVENSEVYGKPTTEFYVNDTFTKTGAIKVIGTSGHDYGEIPMSSDNVKVTELDGITPVDLTSPTDENGREILVSYGGATTEYTINVKNKVKAISVNGSVEEAKYNQALTAKDFEGITVTEIMEDDTEGRKDVPLDFSWVNTSEFNNKTIKTQELKVNYPYGEDTIEGIVEVSVKDELLGITIDNFVTDYVYNDELDYTGAQFSAQYVSGLFGPMDFGEDDLTISEFDSTTIGEQELTFTYNDGTDEASTTLTVNVEKAELEVPECEQLEIVEGKELSTIAGKLPTTEYGQIIWKEPTTTLTYDEENEENNIHEIEAIYKINDTYSPYYKDIDCIVEVKVLKKEVTGIEVLDTSTNEKTYVEGQNFNPIGMKIKVTYNDEGTSIITVNEESKGLTYSPERALEIGDTQITVNYGGHSAVQTGITVVAKVVTGIEITHAPDKVEYIEGQNLDLTGIIVTATYNDTDTKELATTEYTTNPAEGTALDTVGTQTITVTYTGSDIAEGTTAPTATTTVEVAKKVVTKIEVTHAPNKVEYIEGQELSLTGMIVTATYNDGDKRATTEYTTDPADGEPLNTVGTQTITLTYTGSDIAEGATAPTTTTTVEVAKKVVTGIEITTEPTTKTYVEGHPFDSTGMIVTATYNDGDKRATTEYTITPSGDLTPANTTITITYAGDDVLDVENRPTATIGITVNAREVESITITKPADKTNYYEGQDFDPTGMEITVTYNDGENPMTIDSNYATKGVTFNPSTNLQQSTTEVIVSYREQTATQAITVVPDYVTSIVVVAEHPTYKYGDTIDLSKTKIQKSWASGIEHENDNEEQATLEMISSDKIDAQGKITGTGILTVTVSYTNENGDTLTDTFDIEVEDTITSITMNDINTTYWLGDEVDQNLQITINYGVKSPETIKITDAKWNPAWITGIDMNKLGTQTLTVKYGEDNTLWPTKEISIKDFAKKIDISKHKAVYKIGDNINFANDIIVEKYMASNESVSAGKITNYTISPTTIDTITAKTVDVTVSYTNEKGNTLTDTFTLQVINAIEKAVLNIPDDKKLPEKLGDTLDLSDITITVQKQDKTTEDIPVKDNKNVRIKQQYNPNTMQKQEIALEYTYKEPDESGKEVEKTINVEGKIIITLKDWWTGEIKLSGVPTTSVLEQDLDLSKAIVSKVMKSGSLEESTTITGEMISGYDKTKIGKQTITVTNWDKTATFDVTVVDFTLGISMKTQPNKTEYTQGESLDITGATINVTKQSGIKEVVVTKEMISGYNANKAGTQTITVSYDGFTTTFIVNVKAKTTDKPTTPTEPTNPSTPSVPSRPTTPINPSTPTTPIVPTEPTVDPSEKYTVTFVDYNGEVIKEEEVEYGKSATEPKVEKREGYNFIGWDKEFDNIKEDMIVTAKYKKVTTTKPSEKPSEVLGEKDENKGNSNISDTLVPATIGLGVTGLLLLLISAITRKNTQIYAVTEDGKKLIGKEKLTKKNKTIYLDIYKDNLENADSVEIKLDEKTLDKLTNEKITIVFNGKAKQHKVADTIVIKK